MFVTADKHLQGAARNLAFADRLKKSGQNDPATLQWAVTALFYAAVHSVRAYLSARHGVQVTAHSDMPGLIAKYPELKGTQRDYDMLKQQSHSARYYLNESFTWDDYDKLRAAAVRISNAWLAKTQTALQRSLGTS